MNEIILVTGGNGLVGSALKKINKIDQHQYQWIYSTREDCDLLNKEQTIGYFRRIRPTMVIHLAANVGGLFKNLNNKILMFEDNISINSNVLAASYDVRVKKFIGCLSTCIFPDEVTYPIDESMLHNGAPHHSNDAYAYAKRMLEVQIRAYREQYGVNYQCIIPTNIYGENDNYNLINSHVIPALIHRCYLAKMNGEKFVISGSGNPLRQFIYSEDLAKLIIRILNEENEHLLIIAPGVEDEISIKDVVKIIAENFSLDLNLVEFDLTKSDGQFRKTASNKKLIQIFGPILFTKIEEGIKKSVEWFVENYDKCRK